MGEAMRPGKKSQVKNTGVDLEYIKDGIFKTMHFESFETAEIVIQEMNLHLSRNVENEGECMFALYL